MYVQSQVVEVLITEGSKRFDLEVGKYVHRARIVSEFVGSTSYLYVCLPGLLAGVKNDSLVTRVKL